MADHLEKSEDDATLEASSSSIAASSVPETPASTEETAPASPTDRAGKKNGFARRGKQDEGSALPRTPDLGDFVRHGTPLSESDAHILELTNIKQRAQSKQQSREKLSVSAALGASKRDARRAAELGLAAISRNQHLETKMRTYTSRFHVQTELETEYKKAQTAYQQANENLHQIIERLKIENAELKSQLAAASTAE